MKVAVTGLPRTRSTLIVNELSKAHALRKPDNAWGETHKYGENYKDWLQQDNVIFKLWKPFTENYVDSLLLVDNIIITYTEDIPLFVAKLLRAEVTNDWGIDKRSLEKISFRESLPVLVGLEPKIKEFIASIDELMSNKDIVLKSAFVNEDICSIHVQSTFDNNIANTLRLAMSKYTPAVLDDYISAGKEDFYEYVCQKIGRTL